MPSRFETTPADRSTRNDVPASMVKRDVASPSILTRIRSEFLEMPGLHLTIAQAARLWAIDQFESARILDGLTATGFLARTPTGMYARVSA